MPVRRLLNLLFPADCPLCGKRSDGLLSHPLCRRCWEGIRRYTGPACRTCGMPLPSPHSGLCERCLRKSPPFKGVFYYGLYEGALREAIHILKFRGKKRLALPLTRLLCRIERLEADVIIPVPVHPKSLKERGFNQAATLARHLSREWKIPLMQNCLVKVKDTPPQTEMSGKERIANVRGVFQVKRPVESLRIILLDDVVTTGATVGECSRVLIKAGARSVTVIALAYTPLL